MSWLVGWSYRKSHVVNAQAGAGTNYQKQVTVHYGAGVDLDDDVYLNSKCKTDFGDIRFTDDNGSTLLDYWIESKTDSDNAVFWVEIADSLEASAQTIYVYYGKADATTTSNGDNTFLLFDHFTGIAIDPAKWSSSGNVTVSDSKIRFVTAGKEIRPAIQSISAFNVQKIRLRGLFKWSALSTGRQFGMNIKNAIYQNLMFYLESAVAGAEDVYWDNDSAGYDYLANKCSWAINTDYIMSFLSDASVPINIWERNGITIDTYNGEGFTSQLTTLLIGFYIFNYNDAAVVATTNFTLDWVLLSKYVNPEPTHGAWGTETAAPVAVSLGAPTRRQRKPRRKRLPLNLLLAVKDYLEMKLAVD